MSKPFYHPSCCTNSAVMKWQGSDGALTSTMDGGIQWYLMCYAHVSKGTPKYILITLRDISSRDQYYFIKKKICGKAMVRESSWAQLQTNWITVSIHINRGSLWHKRTKGTSLDKKQCHDLGCFLWSRGS